MQIYFHSRLWSYLPRVPILVEDTVYLLIFFLKIVMLYANTLDFSGWLRCKI